MTVTKAWDDEDDQDGIRPDSVDVQLYADGTASGAAVTLNEDNEWTYTWENLDVNADGEAIEYTVDEPEVPTGYEKTVGEITGDAENGFEVEITNEHEPDKTTVKVTKAWDDEDDQDGIRPDSVDVQLYADGAASGAAITLNKDNSWTYTWSNLDVNADGEAIEYTVDEPTVPTGYEKTVGEITGDAENGFEVEITNKHEPDKTTVKVTKVWDDDSDRDGVRPDSVDVQLYADGAASGAAITLNKDNSWTYTWSNLDVNADGEAIEYTVDEPTVPTGYEKTVGEITGDAENGFEVEITNKHEPDKTTVKVTKVWDDDSDRDGVRPDGVDVQLYADGTASGAAVTLNEDNTWTYTWEGLFVNEAGKAIEYTVDEPEEPSGYEKTVGKVTGDAKTGFEVEITNKHVPDKTTVKVTKAWDDDSDRDGIRPDSVGVQLYANGGDVSQEDIKATQTLNKDNSWTYTWEGLFVNQDGEAIEYTVDEPTVPTDYEKKVGEITGDAKTGFEVKITNKHEPDTTTVKVTKVWDDDDDRDGVRPEGVDVQLYANGTASGAAVTLNEDNTWTYTWEDLFVNEAGKAIEYTVDEPEEPTGYEKTVGKVTGDAENGFEVEITNKHEPERTKVKVTKVWNDNDDKDKIRPKSVDVVLLANGDAVSQEGITATQTLSKSNSWTYTWEDLYVNEGGKPIKYTVDEDPVPEGYTVAITGNQKDGFVVTNSHQSEPKKEVFKGSTTIKIDGKTVKPGDILRYEITYTNTTGETAEKVKVTDKIPAHTKFVSADKGGSESGGVVTWTFSNVPNGATRTVSFKVKVKKDVSGESLKNIGKLIIGDNEYDTNEVTNPTPPKKSVYKGGTTVSIDGKKVKPGQVLTYEIKYTNGKDEEVIVDITDAVPKYTSYVTGSASDGGYLDNGVVTWSGITLEAGESITVTFDVKVKKSAFKKTIKNNALVLTDDNVFKTNEVTNTTPPKPPHGPDTGDTNDLTKMLGLMATSGLGLVYMFFRRRREEQL